MARSKEVAADYILPLNINGLQGRMLRAPSITSKKREILLVYGHHAALERWWSLVENLRPYGNVTMPDMPGFGGMESFSKIRTRPSLDAYADYLAAFIKLRYRQRRVTIYAVSYGFLVVTRMLQRYPELTKKVDILISAVGFMHRDDLAFKPHSLKFYKKLARLFATRLVAFFIRYLFLNRLILRFLYAMLPSSKRRMIEVTPEEFEASMDFEVVLWQSNDVRTHWLTTSEFLNLDNCRKQIPLAVTHIVSANDFYINNLSVEQHMRQVFSDYQQMTAETRAHVPSILADKSAMSVLVPPPLKRMLNKKQK
ncbi:alpha/beta hydrolase [Candidatus Saccharibacteria bacterium]|nr:alpha/beta hydrolase [Candidatus Saccharibacteria bacterium]